MNTVKITIDLPVNRLADLQRFLLNETPGLQMMVDAPVPVPEVPAVVAAPSEPEPTVAEPEPANAEPEPTPVKVTKTMIRALGVEYTKAGKQKELAEVFAKFGASSLSKLEEKDYAEVYKLLGGK